MATRHKQQLLVAAACALAAACAGPGGVTLGDDWKGSSAFALVDVDGLATVVGVNAVKGRAESLAVVPQQADDGAGGAGPQIVALADGRRLVTVPRKGGASDRRYVLDPRARVLDGVGTGAGPSRVLPGKTLVGEVAGLPAPGPGRRAWSRWGISSRG
ncbi:hypothetical protein C3489_17385 [Streptomyces sp. Ru71]|uniref:hypothetical protein n=1 Tax=Streptomyces sp. Ru71 TaxID=2080746 RepID=UPI000CDDB33A|nr:hypothetical protein [Streptomyces sp. Ru71]POX52744.1 hypothetical protein C3489_17385 [Streptomyces sp. Ru71]